MTTTNNTEQFTIVRHGVEHVVSLPQKSPEQRERMRHKRGVRHAFMDARPKHPKPRMAS